MTLVSDVRSVSKPQLFRNICTGTFMVFGTSVGAGMLGIPAMTAGAGFGPAMFVTIGVWLFMLATGLLLLEVTFRMPSGVNIISLSKRFLGTRGQWVVAALFLFLYGCLLVAYLSGGGPFFAWFFSCLGVHSCPLWISQFLFIGVFGGVILAGTCWINRVNLFLSLGMFIAYAALLFLGSQEVKVENLSFSNYSLSLSAIPVLFSAFGFHNVVPSMAHYLQQEKKSLRLSVILGTFLAFVFYMSWQWLVLGSVPVSALNQVKEQGLPVTYALQTISKEAPIYMIGQIFAFLALTTSFLGVGLAFVDFVKDAFRVLGKDVSHMTSSFLSFIPPLILVMWVPTLFERALGVAGGFGVSLLNGVLPVWLFWQMHRMYQDKVILHKKLGVLFLMILGLLVVLLEGKVLLF